jgi:transposase
MRGIPRSGPEGGPWPEADRGNGPAGALTSAEREELAQLWRRVREREKTVDALGKTTAFFAQGKMR